MKSKRVLAGAISLLVMIVVSGLAQAGIENSKHDMTASSATQTTISSTTEVCVFCHTPHGSDTSASAPLWNRFLDTGQTYTRYSSLGTATLDGKEAPIGSVSLACLSCHDGTQARDAVINAPGSGGYNAGGAVIGGGAGSFMAGTGPIPVLGTDLTDDHPVSIEYAGGACTGSTADCDPSGLTTGDPDFQTAQYEVINAKPNWWVDTSGGTADSRDKTDMILYARSDFTGGSGTGPSVECGSCHDPHEDTSQPVSFLRIDNTNSAVCLACHIK